MKTTTKPTKQNTVTPVDMTAEYETYRELTEAKKEPKPKSFLDSFQGTTTKGRWF